MFKILGRSLITNALHAVVVQVGVLLSRKLANAHAGVDSPGIQKLVSDLRDNYQFLVSSGSTGSGAL